ncbi:Asp-tRNA(Asn)/Glu-tRNA(Gln) amidotransferase GatCAB subunit B [Candidatus Shapirobacteria bacterium]|nr:MAG: Asp-tRNA(Asn)/Glu-tRNA(Gln) amidotransferase GatCAB subunit B [Candidatus Shapirobacteria bacterium]
MKTKNKYKLVCGLEIHVELKTASKMFCGCKNDPFGAKKPNIYTCPVCLGLPGALPVPNKKAIEWIIRLGLALKCPINTFSKFDRKHYFYPDLAKGYQISQYDIPFCGPTTLKTTEGIIRINRIHLEEDTGKLLHQTVDGEQASLVDFNRSGVPLIEIVSEADIKSSKQAVEYAKKLRRIIRFLGIADCDMEKGGMRLEANISLKKDNDVSLPNYKVEVKNINSFRYMQKAIEYEIQRQKKILSKGKQPIQETRGFNPQTGKTFSQRQKEGAKDYRYFPDPDLSPIFFTKEQIEEIARDVPELPSDIKKRWIKKYGIRDKCVDRLVKNSEQVKWLEKLFSLAAKKQINPNKLVKAILNKKINCDLTTSVNKALSLFVTQNSKKQLDIRLLEKIVNDVMLLYPAQVEAFRAGKTTLINFFVGQVAKKVGKGVDIQQIRQFFEKKLLKKK